VVPSKFCTPLPAVLAPAAFFEKWNALGAPAEAQVVCTLREKPTSMSLFQELAAKGLKLAVLSVRAHAQSEAAMLNGRQPC
jgi:hypothetical protein